MRLEVPGRRGLRTRQGWPQGVLLAALTLAGLALRLLLLGSKSLWLDEADSLRIALAGQQAIWAGASEPNHPPLFYWLLEMWASLGSGERFLRLPGAALGSLAVPLAYFLGRDLADEPVALSASGLVAFSPLLVWYAQELRVYSLLGVAGLAATVALVRALPPTVARGARRGLGSAGASEGTRRGVSLHRWAWWLLFVAAQAAALYLHYSALLLLPLQAVMLCLLVAAGRAAQSAVAPWLAGWAAALALFLPWLTTPAARAFGGSAVTGNKYVTRLLVETLHVPAAWLRLGAGHLAAGVLLIAAAVALACWWLRRTVRTGRAPSLRGSRAVQVPLAALFLLLLVASVVPRGYSLKRQLVLAWPALLLAFAWLWPWSGRPHRALAALGCSLLAALAAVVLVPKQDWRGLAVQIVRAEQPGDAVLLEPEYLAVPFDYYYDGGAEREAWPIPADPDRLSWLLEHHGRVWLVQDTQDRDPQQRTQSRLDARALPVETVRVFRLEARLYTRRAEPALAAVP